MPVQEVAPQVYSHSTAAAGISSFGMSGVNAHAVFASSSKIGLAALSTEQQRIVWQRYSHWPVSSAHHFLQSGIAERKAGICRY